MSTLIVEVLAIDEVNVHPNADRLELAKIKGWQCVVGKGEFKAGDSCIYIPIDSVLPPEVECKIFGPNSKIKLTKSRVRTIKLRGAISQGLIVRLDTLSLNVPVGTDVTETLKITKYEPPPPRMSGLGNTYCATSKKQVNPHFHKYTEIENFKNYPKVFEEGEQVSITEKIHGTNFRCGWVPFMADTIWKKIKRLFGFAPKFEFVYGSHNVQLQNKMGWEGFYELNVYAKIVKLYKLNEILKEGEVLYGEIYGWNIQKNYFYGCKDGEHKLVAFDIMKDEKYLDPHEFIKFCLYRDLPMVPVLHLGGFNMEMAKSLTQGESKLDSTVKVREGIVIKPLSEQTCYMGRKVLKFINDEYLLKDQSDFH